MSNRTVNLDENLYSYLLKHSVHESAIQSELRELTAKHEWARMQISPDQAQFMSLLVELTGAKQAIEVGTFTGYSALTIADALGKDGQLICCDTNKEWTDVGIPFWKRAGVFPRIDLRIAPALETLEQLINENKNEYFDLIFIDADKSNYINYYERCLVLLRQGGLILIDNTLWGGAVADDADQDEDTIAIRELNDLLYADQRVNISLVPIGDGLTLVRKR